MGRLCVLTVVAVVGAASTAAAAVAPPDPGSTQTFTYGSGSSAYPYIVYVPTSYRPTHPAPLVVMTHGCQTTADEQLRANLYNQVAEREGIVMLYPDVKASEAAQPGPLRQCWLFPVPTNWHRDAGDPAAIAGMTRTVMARWRVDPERVYMVGMSAGSFMTSIMAAAYPDLFAAVAINAGGAYADGTCLFAPGGIPASTSAQWARTEMGVRARIVPRMVMGGDHDQGVPPACADKALEQGLRTDNLVVGASQTSPIPLTPASAREVPKAGGYSTTVSTYRDPAGCIIGERWLIHGMNHFWPGGSTDPALASFTDPKGPNGAEATWQFLSRYTKSGTAMPCAEAPPRPAPPPRAPAATRCPSRSVTVIVPPGARSLRVTVNGRRAGFRHFKRRVRIQRRATTQMRTTIVVRGRSAAGRPFVLHRRYRGCR